MNKFLIIAVLLTFFSCSKTTKTEKRMDGNWTVVGYETMDHNGFTTKYNTVSGTGDFNANNEPDNTLSININYDINGNAQVFQLDGTFSLIDDEYYMIIRDVNGVNDTLLYNRNLILTKTDLRTAINDGTLIHTIIFSR